MHGLDAGGEGALYRLPRHVAFSASYRLFGPEACLPTASQPVARLMAGLSFEFWALVIVGFFIWLALITGVARIVTGLADVEAAVTRMHAALIDEPDLSEIGPRMERVFRETGAPE